MANPITPRRVLRAALVKDLTAFVERAFRDLDSRTPLRLAPYTEYLTGALIEVEEGRQRRVIINLPPRHLKSILASIVFPAWLLGRDPRLRIAVISHSQSLARDLAVKSHRLVVSDWYREVFPRTRLATDRSSVMDFETTAGGGRYAASLDTGVTGRGFDLIIVDDPLAAQDARSPAERERIHHSYDGMIASRLDNPAKGAIIVVHQRLHEDDLSGYLLRRGGWLHINLPLVAEESARHSIGAVVWDRPAGDVLLPDIFIDEAIRDLRQQHGEAFFATQYQQNPTAAHGELIRPEYIVYFDELPPNAQRPTFSIDTAIKVSEDASFTVVMVIASDAWRHYIIDVLHRRFDLIQMREAVIGMIRQYGPTKILVEDASSGSGLAHTLQEYGHRVDLWPTRGRSKIERLEAHLHLFAQGRVLVRANQPWTVPLVNEWAAFPNARHDDQVDAITQYLDFVGSRSPVKPVVLGAGGAAERAAAKLFPSPRPWSGHPMRPRPGRPPRRR
jgi:predicted phage terminase large subunit-like protein